jgi:5-(carboxyamino)imidazole ribonucleotide mutase
MTKFVAILMGSDSDLPVLESAFETLQSLNIPFEAHILSAHRCPEQAAQYVKDATARGCAVFIAAAGLAAHLAGMVAAHTIRPVIGIPLDAGSLKGMDALLATVQMPGGTPVACTSIGKAGAVNAAFLAAEILAITDPALADLLLEHRQQKRASLKRADDQLQQSLKQKSHV